MKTFFECEYQFDKNKYISIVKENLKQPKIVLKRILCIIFILIYTILILYFKAYFCLILVLAMIYIIFFKWRIIVNKNFNKLVRLYQKESWIRKFVFSEDKIEMIEEKQKLYFSYTDIKSIEEKDKYTEIYFIGKFYLYIYKDSFTKGTYADFKKFIYDKIGSMS